jgi:hypothetical protein
LALPKFFVPMKKLFPLFFTLLCSLPVFAQDTETEEDKPSLDKGTIASKFDFVIDESKRWHYAEYLQLKTERLQKLKSHVLDSLRAVHKQLETSQQNVDNQGKGIDNLNTQLDSARDSVQTLTNEKNSIEFLGAQTNKGTYKTIMWAIVGGLIILLGFFIYKFNSSNVLTVEAKKSFQELQQEFENHKKTAREREQKLARQLQDELNKRM